MYDKAICQSTHIHILIGFICNNNLQKREIMINRCGLIKLINGDPINSSLLLVCQKASNTNTSNTNEKQKESEKKKINK